MPRRYASAPPAAGILASRGVSGAGVEEVTVSYSRIGEVLSADFLLRQATHFFAPKKARDGSLADDFRRSHFFLAVQIFRSHCLSGRSVDHSSEMPANIPA